MKITLEFDNAEKFFQELPRFAALMGFSGKFANFEHVKKSDQVPSLEEPELPDIRANAEGRKTVAGTPEQVQKTLEAEDLADQIVKQAEAQEAAKEEKPKKAAKAKKEEPKKEEPLKTEEPEPAEEGSKEVTDTDVREVLGKVAAKMGKPSVKDILKAFGVTKFPSLDPKHYAAVIEKAEEVLKDG